MLHWIATRRKSVAEFRHRLEQSTNIQQPRFLSIALFVVVQFALAPVRFIQAVLELPLHILLGPRQSFELGARRSEQMEFLESYSQFVNRGRYAVATFMGLVVLVVVQFMLTGLSLYQIGKPSPASAYTTNVTLNPTYDISGSFTQDYVDDGFGGCTTGGTSYSCDSSSLTVLKASGQLHAGDCSISSYSDTNYASTMTYDLSSIPSNAVIQSVQLTINVLTTTTSSPLAIYRSITDDGSTLACGSVYNDVFTSGRVYNSSVTWSTTGSKSYSLGSFAVSDIQTRLTTTQKISVGIYGPIANRSGQFSSTDSSSNKPQLQVTYTVPPQAPTASSHSTITTSSITWTWTDNATADTANAIKDAGGTTKCSTGAVSGTGSTGTCTENSLSANTQYTRHPTVTDADGSTDGSSTSAYTAIESPTGVTLSGITNTSITAASSTSLSNLTSGTSGVFFQENSTSTNSGWLTTNSWSKSGLTANTQYTFQAKARNGDGIETSFSPTTSVYTLAASAAASSTRSPSTWYGTANFPFSNDAGWGSGGVQYYRYVWDQNSTHAFTGSEDTWSDADVHCPGGTCTTVGTTLTNTATSDGNDWYLHVQSYNGDDVVSGSSLNLGPYYYDHTAPGTIATVNDGLGSDESSTTSTTTLSANWTAVTDSGAGLDHYQYAIGTTSGGTQTRDWSDTDTTTEITVTGLTLSPGVTYYFSVRAVDALSNTGAVTSSNGITVATGGPTITSIVITPSTTSATVAWTTSTPATSEVQFGLTASYGSSTGIDMTLVTSHSATLTGLTAGTSYHLKVFSTDAGHTTTSSADQTFQTIAATPTTPTTPSTTSVNPPTIANWHDGDVTADTTPIIAGSGPARGGVFIVVDRKLVRTAGVNTQGLYSISLTEPLSLGAHEVIVRAKTKLGEVSDESSPITLNVVAPSTATKVVDRVITDGTRPSVRFTLEAPAWSTIEVYVDAIVVKRFAVTDLTTRHVTVTPSTTLSYGKHVITLVTYDSNNTPSIPSGATTFTKTTVANAATVNVSYGQITSYVVQPGDSLWSIAQHFLGNGARWAEIQRANISDHSSLQSAPHTIYVGWTLVIPST